MLIYKFSARHQVCDHRKNPLWFIYSKQPVIDAITLQTVADNGLICKIIYPNYAAQKNSSSHQKVC
jgi:hypothetical protein